MLRMMTFVVFVVVVSWVCSLVTATITYDDKAIILNGTRRILSSGSIHYPRSTPEMWPDLIQKAKDGGLDVIQTYVFWNGHEPSPGKYYFEGRFDLVRFIKSIQQAGLYVHLRIGPYICGEWHFGGFPVWLKYVPGMSFRTDNEPFKAAMKGFTEKIVNMMKSEKLFEPQGGPIIFSQIENEYGPVEWEIGAPGKAYTNWAAQMALGLDTGVPWIMCKQEDVPDKIIDTCNGFYCEGFIPKKPHNPKMFTEVWTGWYTEFGGPNHVRPAEDLAFGVARFIQKNGSFFNYYMYHGGTNFGRTSAGLFVTTSYEYDAPIDEYGLLNQPKWGHLKELHKAIKQSEPALVSAYPTVTYPGKNQEVHEFQSKSGACAAFLSNYDTKYSAKVYYRNTRYDLPPWSISILPDCKSEIYNTAKGSCIPRLELESQDFGKSSDNPLQADLRAWQYRSVLVDISFYLHPKMSVTIWDGGSNGHLNDSRVISQSSQPKWTPAHAEGLSWQSYNEEIPSADDDDKLPMYGLYEQLNVTRDSSDYLWYLTNVHIASDEGFLKTGQDPILTVMSAGHALHVFVNGELSGTLYGSLGEPRITFSNAVKLKAGINKIALLSVQVGLANVGTYFETWNVGVLGPVTLKGLNSGTWDMTKWQWSYKVGQKSESLSLHSLAGSSSVSWQQGQLVAKNQPLTWYKATFSAPEGNEALGIDMNSMGKGQVWINGESIGRYWAAQKARGNCAPCHYEGAYHDKKCLTWCGEPSQRWYHVPRSWLRPSKNLLVVFEELGGEPSWITLVERTR